MADRRSPRTLLMLSPEALFRYQNVSAVKARALSAQRTDADGRCRARGRRAGRRRDEHFAPSVGLDEYKSKVIISCAL